jgi:hypothetical protein
MQSNYEIIVSDLGYKVAYKSGSLDSLSIELLGPNCKSLRTVGLLCASSVVNTVYIVVFFLSGDSLASEFYIPTFRNTLPSS